MSHTYQRDHCIGSFRQFLYQRWNIEKHQSVQHCDFSCPQQRRATATDGSTRFLLLLLFSSAKHKLFRAPRTRWTRSGLSGRQTWITGFESSLFRFWSTLKTKFDPSGLPTGLDFSEHRTSSGFNIEGIRLGSIPNSD